MLSCKKIVHFIIRCLQFVYYSLFKQGTFIFNNIAYQYNYSLWNVTFSNERAIEVPIAKRLLERHEGQRILEVGNVMHWYSKIRRTVIDKDELGTDIFTFRDPVKLGYNLIISISTIEHIPNSVGAIRKMKSLLARKGLLFVTIPMRQRPDIDFSELAKEFTDFSTLNWENGDEIFVGYYSL